MKDQNEQWTSRLGVILAVMGSAVGLGNFLRFPGLAAKYEGGIFLIPYFIAFFLLGLPIAYIEWTMARYGGSHGFHSAPGIFRKLWHNKLSPYLGILGLIVPIGIYMYYILIESWCLYYALSFFTGGLDLGKSPEVYKSFFNDFIGISANGSVFTGENKALLSVLICVLMNFFFIYRGISKGVEKVSKYGMPVLILLALIVLGRVLTLGTPDPAFPERNVINGLGFMWNPGAANRSFWDSLLNSQMWLEAAGQIFFSLSVGFGVIINYASYLSKKDDVMLSATTSAAGNEFAEVGLGGLITVPSAFIFLGAAGLIGGTFSLGFVTMPVVFAHMPAGNFFGFLWFFLLFIAAITSSVSMLQPAIAFLEEGSSLSRKHSVPLLALLTLTGTVFIMWFSKDLKALDVMDFWVGTFLIYLLALIQVLMAGWVFGARRILEEARHGSLMRMPKFMFFIIKYVCPAYLLLVFSIWCWQKLPDQWLAIRTDLTTQFTVGFIFLITLLFVFLTRKAVTLWQKNEAEQ